MLDAVSYLLWSYKKYLFIVLWPDIVRASVHFCLWNAQYVLSYWLTEAEKSDHPAPSPMTNLPVRITVRNAALLPVIWMEYEIMSHPQRSGIPPAVSAGCLPRPAKQIRSSPNMPPTSSKAYWISRHNIDIGTAAGFVMHPTISTQVFM